MKKIVTLFILLLAIWAQTSLLPNIFPQNVIPEIVLILIIFWVTQRGFNNTWQEAILAGFLLDIFSFAPFGTNILALTVVIFGISFLSKRFLVSQSGWQFLILVLLIIGGSIIDEATRFLTTKWTAIFWGNNYLLSVKYFSAIFLEKTLGNVVFFGVLYVPLKKFEKYIIRFDQRIDFKK